MHAFELFDRLFHLLHGARAVDDLPHFRSGGGARARCSSVQLHAVVLKRRGDGQQADSLARSGRHLEDALAAAVVERALNVYLGASTSGDPGGSLS